jgi:hypothetical protein
MKRKRVIGTIVQAIERAEQELGYTFPPSFRSWVLDNNGIGIEQVSIFPVYDERDPRKTSDSITREYKIGWLGTIENFQDEMNFEHLLPFSSYGTGDYYCFDYSRKGDNGEVPVVRRSHETGESEDRGKTFVDFIERLIAGEFDDD